MAKIHTTFILKAREPFVRNSENADSSISPQTPSVSEMKLTYNIPKISFMRVSGSTWACNDVRSKSRSIENAAKIALKPQDIPPCKIGKVAAIKTSSVSKSVELSDSNGPAPAGFGRPRLEKVRPEPEVAAPARARPAPALGRGPLVIFKIVRARSVRWLWLRYLDFFHYIREYLSEIVSKRLTYPYKFYYIRQKNEIEITVSPNRTGPNIFDYPGSPDPSLHSSSTLKSRRWIYMHCGLL